MQAEKIGEDIYWVGAKDWNLREFHGFATPRGSTYNAYLIMDEKKVLVDTVKHYCTEEMLARISKVINPAEIDMVVCNHVEMDHSGAIPKIMELAPNAIMVTSASGKIALTEHYDTSKWNFHVVKTGDSINIGKRNLEFICTPLLHWPDSMMTYIPEDRYLLPNDAFGQHMATDGIFADEAPIDVVFEEAKKYFANILYPYCMQAGKALKQLADKDIKMIAPSHGCIWRTHVKEIIEEYAYWSSGENKNKALVIYDTMWGSTEDMADAVKSGFEDAGIKVVKRSLNHCDISDVAVDLLDAKYIAIGNPTLNNNLFPRVAGFMAYLKGLAPKNKVGFAFGSFGWKGGVLNIIQETFTDLGWETPLPPFETKYVPRSNILEELREEVSSKLCK